jgi:hypothetical protein
LAEEENRTQLFFPSDKAGNATVTIDANGFRTTYLFDAGNPQTVTAVGNLIKKESVSNTWAYGYDNLYHTVLAQDWTGPGATGTLQEETDYTRDYFGNTTPGATPAACRRRMRGR